MITDADLTAFAHRPCPVPLRASAVALLIREHTRSAAEARDAAHANRRTAARVTGSDPDDVSFWRETYARSAVEADARADRHEAIAALWAGRVR